MNGVRFSNMSQYVVRSTLSRISMNAEMKFTLGYRNVFTGSRNSYTGSFLFVEEYFIVRTSALHVTWVYICLWQPLRLYSYMWYLLVHGFPWFKVLGSIQGSSLWMCSAPRHCQNISNMLQKHGEGTKALIQHLLLFMIVWEHWKHYVFHAIQWQKFSTSMISLGWQSRSMWQPPELLNGALTFTGMYGF